LTAYNPTVLLAASSAPSTTSIPTWLAVLAPILAALVAAAAGIAGTLIGGRAARRTAERAADLTRQDEQRRWNRERREQAYVALLDRRNQLVEMRSHWDVVDADYGPKIDEAHGNVRYDDGFEREDVRSRQGLSEALATVELVGSAAAVRLARRWVERLCASPPRLGVQDEPIRDPTPEASAWCPTAWGRLADEPTEYRDRFIALIRTELGVDV
jgi:hypothetical protein